MSFYIVSYFRINVWYAYFLFIYLFVLYIDRRDKLLPEVDCLTNVERCRALCQMYRILLENDCYRFSDIYGDRYQRMISELRLYLPGPISSVETSEPVLSYLIKVFYTTSVDDPILRLGAYLNGGSGGGGGGGEYNDMFLKHPACINSLAILIYLLQLVTIDHTVVTRDTVNKDGVIKEITERLRENTAWVVDSVYLKMPVAACIIGVSDSCIFDTLCDMRDFVEMYDRARTKHVLDTTGTRKGWTVLDRDYPFVKSATFDREYRKLL